MKRLTTTFRAQRVDVATLDATVLEELDYGEQKEGDPSVDIRATAPLHK